MSSVRAVVIQLRAASLLACCAAVLGRMGREGQPGPRGALGLCWGAAGTGQSCLAAGGCVLSGCLPADRGVGMLGQQRLGEMGREL